MEGESGKGKCGNDIPNKEGKGELKEGRVGGGAALLEVVEAGGETVISNR